MIDAGTRFEAFLRAVEANLADADADADGDSDGYRA